MSSLHQLTFSLKKGIHIQVGNPGHIVVKALPNNKRSGLSIVEKQINTKPRRFPGTTGNPFDVFLHKTVKLEKIPGVVFAVILFGIALLPAKLDLPRAFSFWSFFMIDWALLAALPRVGRSFGPAKPSVIALAIVRSLVAFLPFPSLVGIFLQFVGVLLVIWSFWIEPHHLTITHQKLMSKKIAPGSKIRILHLGDLHIERVTNRERKLNQLITELQPDLILFSGDFINLSYLRDPIAWEAARSVMQEWKAPLGTFVVTGSPAVDLEDVMPTLLQDLPVRWLRDQNVSIPFGDSHLDIIGLNCTHKPFIDVPMLETVAGRYPKDFTILLYHSPDLAPEAAKMGIDLQLSGHTHGGQVRLPFYGALFAGSLYGKRFESGRYQLKDLTLYVSRGIGLEGQSAPRVRFLCPPEIILWEIEGTRE